MGPFAAHPVPEHLRAVVQAPSSVRRTRLRLTMRHSVPVGPRPSKAWPAPMAGVAVLLRRLLRMAARRHPAAMATQLRGLTTVWRWGLLALLAAQVQPEKAETGPRGTGPARATCALLGPPGSSGLEVPQEQC